MDVDWKTVTAVWGAGLSTALAVRGLLADRPAVTFEPTHERQSIKQQWFFIRIRNTTGRPLNVRRLYIRCPKEACATLMAERGAKGAWNRWDPIRRNDIRNLVLFPDQGVIVQLDLAGIDEAVLAYISWDFMGLSFNLPRFSFLYRSRKWVESHRELDFMQRND